jgi:hypothetical protein
MRNETWCLRSIVCESLAIDSIASQHHRIRPAAGGIELRRMFAPKLKVKVGSSEKSHILFTGKICGLARRH